MGVVLGLAACSAPGPGAPPVQSSAPAAVLSAPEWRPGSRWVYDWKSGAESGTKTFELVEVKEVNQVRYYVARFGTLDHYFTLDLRWAAAVQASKVVSRMVPPQPWFAWPLEVGRHWSYEGIFEEGTAKRPENQRFAVVAFETIEVPAGRLEAFKIFREAANGDADEYWYAPRVRFYARWLGRRGAVQFEEHLREYPGGPPAAPPPARPAPRAPTRP